MRKNLKLTHLREELNLLKDNLNSGNVEQRILLVKNFIENYLKLNGISIEDDFSFVKEAEFYGLIDSINDWFKIINGNYKGIDVNEKIDFVIKKFEEILS